MVQLVDVNMVLISLYLTLYDPPTSGNTIKPQGGEGGEGAVNPPNKVGIRANFFLLADSESLRKIKKLSQSHFKTNCIYGQKYGLQVLIGQYAPPPPPPPHLVQMGILTQLSLTGNLLRYPFEQACKPLEIPVKPFLFPQFNKG